MNDIQNRETPKYFSIPETETPAILFFWQLPSFQKPRDKWLLLFSRMLIAFFSTSSASWASRSSRFRRASLSAHQRRNLPEPRTGISPDSRKSFSHFCQSAVTHTPRFWGTTTNTKLLVIGNNTGLHPNLNCLSCCFAIMRSSFSTILLLYHVLSIWNFLILTCTIYILAPHHNKMIPYLKKSNKSKFFVYSKSISHSPILPDTPTLPPSPSPTSSAPLFSQSFPPWEDAPDMVSLRHFPDKS